MRPPLLLVCCLCLIPLAGGAETLQVATPVRAVTVFSYGAMLTRRASVDVTAGQHRLIIADLPPGIEPDSLRVQVSGAHKGAMSLREEDLPPARAFEHPDVAAARAAVLSAEAALNGAQDRVAAARLAAEAAETRLQFLSGLGRSEGAASATPERLRALSALVGEEALDARRNAHTAEIAARAAETALPDLQAALEVARAELRAIAPQEQARSVLTLEIDAAEAGVAEVEITTYGYAEWAPVYDIHLSRGASPTLELRRGALVRQSTGEAWRDVQLTLSTLRPADQIAPSQLFPWLRRAVDPAPVPPPPRASAAAVAADGLAEPMIESPVVMEKSAAAITDGYALVYTYPSPITILSGGDAVRIELGSLTTGAEIEARAVPQFDETAYLVARMVNDTGQELLPSDSASMYVDGDWVGQHHGFEGLAKGAKAELPFGPIRGLRLERTVINRSEGDTGLITRSNTEVQSVLVEIENLTGETWPLRLLDRVPYAEQEAVVIDWSADPAPTETDVEMKRGILGWEMLLAPGDAQRIRLNSTITWPEGKLLR